MTTRTTTLLVLLACFSVPAVAAAQTSGEHALGFAETG